MLVLDTHVLIWYLLGSKRLPETLRKSVDDARMRGDRLIVPTVVLAEALYISERHPETFRFADLHRVVRDHPEFLVVGFDEAVLEEVLRVQKIPELHDRIIVATARCYGARLATRDRVIATSGEAGLTGT